MRKKSVPHRGKRVIAIICALLFVTPFVYAKKYPFTMKRTFDVSLVKLGKEGTYYVKAWGTANNADKAIAQAQQNAVAACLFWGLDGGIEGASPQPAMCKDGIAAYEENKKYFDDFFKKGYFLNYVENVNQGYPTGQNNLRVKGGRKVGIHLLIKKDALRKKLEKDGIIKSINSYF